MSKQTDGVGSSIGVLCMTVCFIYVIFFGVHGESLEDDLAYLAESDIPLVAGQVNGDLVQATQQAVEKTAEQATQPDIWGLEQQAEQVVRQAAGEAVGNVIGQVAPQGVADWAQKSITTGQPTPFDAPGRNFQSVQELFGTAPAQEATIEEITQPLAIEQQEYIAFPDTWQWKPDIQPVFAGMKSMDLLELSADAWYILKNMDNTHFVRLNHFNRDIKPKILSLGGNMVEISDESRIKQDQLFGDKVWFINVPEYENIKVLMIVHFADKNDTRFLQVDKDTYPLKKQELAMTFGQFYNW